MSRLIWCRRGGRFEVGKLTVGLASHRPCMIYPPTDSEAQRGRCAPCRRSRGARPPLPFCTRPCVSSVSFIAFQSIDQSHDASDDPHPALPPDTVLFTSHLVGILWSIDVLKKRFYVIRLKTRFNIFLANSSSYSNMQLKRVSLMFEQKNARGEPT